MGSGSLCGNQTETASSRLRDTASKQEGEKQQYLGLHLWFLHIHVYNTHERSTYKKQ